MTPEVKTCSKCDKEKPVVEFYRNRDRPDGLTSECRDCTKMRVIRYQEQRMVENPEEFRARSRDAQRRYRRTDKGKKATNKNKDYRQALSILRERHKAEFRDILDDIRGAI